jgi:hypothetical protein
MQSINQSFIRSKQAIGRKILFNAPDNTNSNVNSVDDNNLNDIPVSMDCEHECIICNSLFQTNEQDKYTCEPSASDKP